MLSDYPRSELLAETDWLADHLGDPGLRIVDCDEFAAYQRLHIPSAIGLRVHHYLKDPDNPYHLMPPEMFQEVMSQHGISNDHLVVAYDSSGGLYAARLWWALDYYGHANCKLLNGGFHKWFNEGRPVSRDLPHVQPAPFRVRPGSDCLCTLQDVRDTISRDDVVIWDVRAEEEHTGEDPRLNRYGGHIPSDIHLEWLDLTAPPERSGLLLPAEEIRRRLEAAGIRPEKAVLTY